MHWILESILLVRLNLSHALQYMLPPNFRTELNYLALGFCQHVWHSNYARCLPDLFSINDLLLDREEKVQSRSSWVLAGSSGTSRRSLCGWKTAWHPDDPDGWGT